MEIRCPKCNELLFFDGAGETNLLAQVRDSEFEKEVSRRVDAATKLMEKNSQVEKELAVRDARVDLENKVRSYELQLTHSKTEVELAVMKAVMAQKIEYEAKLNDANMQVEYYKDLKTRMSTKMVGETLEQHCLMEFNKLRATAFRNAYFEKDNEVSKSGSKGDFIYRETDENGVEIISILFEMKNEMDTTDKKHRNEDFFRKLDSDRKEKKCEYAVLVSMLEADNELYNQGIVDVSYQYAKMYVVRPQFFIPIITVLRNAAMNALESRQELARVRNQNLDIAHFEDELVAFKSKFGQNYTQASRRFFEAIDEIDKSMLHLQKTRDALVASERQLRLANDKAEDLTVKRLCKNSPSMLKEFNDKSSFGVEK